VAVSKPTCASRDARDKLLANGNGDDAERHLPDRSPVKTIACLSTALSVQRFKFGFAARRQNGNFPGALEVAFTSRNQGSASSLGLFE
jgi:hypothetical protein